MYARCGFSFINCITVLQAIFITIGFILVSPFFSFAENLPEYFGVYARYKNGELVEIKEQSHSRTGSSCLVISGNDSGKVPSRLYVTEMPKVELDLSQVDSFYIYGDSKIEKNTAIYYFADYKYFNDSLCTEKGFGKTKPVYIDIEFGCGPSDGMKYKKVKDDLYMFKFPVEESGEYKYCDMYSGKKAGSGENRYKPLTQVSFYGWYYGERFYTFSTVQSVPFEPELISQQKKESSASEDDSEKAITDKSKQKSSSKSKEVSKPKAIDSPKSDVASKEKAGESLPKTVAKPNDNIEPLTKNQKNEMAIKLILETLENGKTGIEAKSNWNDKPLFGVTPIESFKYLNKFPCRHYKVVSYENGKSNTIKDKGSACRAENKWYPYSMFQNPKNKLSSDGYMKEMVGY